MAQVLATPGVYIEEKSAFPSSAVAVATAVPAFIGYTATAERNKNDLTNVPTRITSLGEYHEFFGGAPKVMFTVTQEEVDEGGEKVKKLKYEVDPASKYYLYHSLKLFFANGGSTCYIVSIGKYGGGVKKDELIGGDDTGIKTLLKEPEPTMLVIPDAVLLADKAECDDVQKAMLMHCGFDMKSRVALLDVYNGDQKRTRADDDVIDLFREGVGTSFLQWGAAYYPWLDTTIISAEDVNYGNVKEAEGEPFKALLAEEFAEELAKDEPDPRVVATKAEIDKIGTEFDKSLHETLLTISPTYKSLMGELRNRMNVIPPSAAMAGVISMVDNSIGVFKSPANVSVGSVIKPSVNITHKEQEDLNLPLNGKAVNAIRSFPGKGVLVWGARTLDGNSQDWRYLSVRRTIIMIEQSLKTATEAYVFEPNVVNTWVTVKGMMTNFLTEQWKQGALAGAVPEDAFSVDVGLGSTMTPTDILDGRMNITIKLAVVRPAEFIVITIQQQMQKS